MILNKKPHQTESILSFQLRKLTFLFRLLNFRYVYVWHALLGYWGGLDPNASGTKKYDPKLRYPVQSPGNLANTRDIYLLMPWRSMVLVSLIQLKFQSFMMICTVILSLKTLMELRLMFRTYWKQFQVIWEDLFFSPDIFNRSLKSPYQPNFRTIA